MTAPDLNVDHLFDGLIHGDRLSLARSITLVESRKNQDRIVAIQLMTLVDKHLQQCAKNMPSDQTLAGWTMAITGPPGVGKSTFIDKLGVQLVELGHRVAVLAIDPSSVRSGGSILGDKTRMHQLASRDEAYIRPSPSGSTHGGTSAATKEAIDLCLAAGYDTVLVETVGVGQNEIAVSDLVDWTLLLLMGRSGDDLQGIKRGIVEAADMVLVNKADSEGYEPALETQRYYQSALSLFPPHSLPGWKVPCLAISSVQEYGWENFWSTLKDLKALPELPDWIKNKRANQRVSSFQRMLNQALLEHWSSSQSRRTYLDLESDLRTGQISPSQAVWDRLKDWGLKE
ncbi:MAG: methylmalonyl Co-A mutase-associated GTPase MeaB [Sphingomonadales bacterium]|nr:methylmalonyl Co-A mutase-associated GTPase MeaB [Sphingomonadales bacterium]